MTFGKSQASGSNMSVDIRFFHPVDQWPLGIITDVGLHHWMTFLMVDLLCETLLFLTKRLVKKYFKKKSIYLPLTFCVNE